jgi:methylthioribose-1-phosphate isomerase
LSVSFSSIPASPAAEDDSPVVGQSHLSLYWCGAADGYLSLLDQTRLPVELIRLRLEGVEQVYEAIVQLRVRGAPAIGIAAAYGACLALRGQRSTVGASQACGTSTASIEEAAERVRGACQHLATSRPTAVNLFWALDRMQRRLAAAVEATATVEQLAEQLLAEAHAIRLEDQQMCRSIGHHGARLLPDDGGVLTHCNTGGLATAELGTALAAIVTAHRAGKRIRVYADETRPLLQGARLTAWELQQQGVPVTLICDSMAAQVMQQGLVQAVIVGADRIAANGDVANKIGTYGLAVLAQHHRIPFFVAAPSSTFDLELADGSGIPIEQRSPSEVSRWGGVPTAPLEVAIHNPAFDVTPAHLVTALITERGVIDPVDADGIRQLLSPAQTPAP